MKHLMSSIRVLVASDNTDDAQLIQRQLAAHFSQVQVSTDAERCLPDFERLAPEVLVLAFDRLEKAQRYYLGLYRLGDGLPQHPHRTVILCSKDEVLAVFELCKQAYFDDYVLYWPHNHDGSRLAMSVWNAGRKTTALRPGLPPVPGLPAHASQASEPDRLVGLETGNAGTHAVAEVSTSVVEIPIPLLDDQVRRIRRVVMVVDDDAFARMLVGKVLDPLVWETTFAVDGAAALALLKRHRPDVILMDIHLPGLDGVTLTQQLKSLPHLTGIPIVMMTGDACKDALVRSLDAGAASFVVKPFTRASLNNKLQAVLLS